MWKVIIIIIIGFIWINFDIIIKKFCPQKNEIIDDLFIKSDNIEEHKYVITETSNEIIDNVLKKIEF